MSTHPATATRGFRLRRLLPVAVLIVVLLLSFAIAACSGGSATTTSAAAASSTTSSAGSSITTGGSVTTSVAATTSRSGTTSTSTYGQVVANSTTKIVSPAELVVKKVFASVVNVKVQGVSVSPFFGQEQYEGVGSGIIYRADGYILTNDHVVSLNGQPVDSVEVTFASGETVPATIVARDAKNDLALLKVDKTDLVAVAFADPKTLAIGQWAIAIGSPLDYRNSVSVGIVSGLNRDLDTGEARSPQLTGLLQTDAAISPGNSGGGLFNANGELIGMPEAYISAAAGAENLGFAIPAEKVQRLAEQLLSQG